MEISLLISDYKQFFYQSHAHLQFLKHIFRDFSSDNLLQLEESLRRSFPPLELLKGILVSPKAHLVGPGGIRMSWMEKIEKLISGRTSIRHSRICSRRYGIYLVNSQSLQVISRQCQKRHQLHKNFCSFSYCVSQLSACNFIKKQTLAQVFSCFCCEMSKNIFFTEHLLETASEYTYKELFTHPLKIYQKFCISTWYRHSLYSERNFKYSSLF